MQKDRAMIHIKWSIYLFLITQCYSKFHIMNFESHNYLPNELMWMNFRAEANSKTLLIETMDRKMWRAINAQSLTDDLSSDQTVAAQWGTNWLLAFNALKIKLMTFYHHQSDPELSPTVTNRCSLREGSWVLSTYWDYNSTQTSSGICTYDSSLKVLGRWLVPWTAPASTSLLLFLLLLSSTFTRARSGRKWSTAAIYGQELPSLHFPLDRVPKYLCITVGNTLFSPFAISFSQTRHCKPLTALSLFPWRMLTWTTLLSHDSHNLHG